MSEFVPSCTMRNCPNPPRWIGTLYMPMTGTERRSSYERVMLCDEHKADYERMALKREGYALSVTEFDADAFRQFWEEAYRGLENARRVEIEEAERKQRSLGPWWKFWV